MRKLVILIPWLFILLAVLSDCTKNTGAQEARNGTVMIIAANNYAVSTGSGFFVGKPGADAEYIVTNAHVVRGMYGFAAVIDEKNLDKYTLDIVAIDKQKDIAILRASSPIKERKNLILSLGNDIDATDTVFAIGYPGASYFATGRISGDPTDATVTKGIISKTVDFRGVECYQIDASISPGNSGGPLVTEQGYVIGINTFSAALDPNMNFAIKIEELIPILDYYGIPYALKSDFDSAAVIIVSVILMFFGVGGGLFFRIKKKSSKARPTHHTRQPRRYRIGSADIFPMRNLI